jgi:sensor histidine kinase regulating citrate/malate metabolism
MAKRRARRNATVPGFCLYFVDAMVDSYGGEIRFEDAEPGSRFVIELPTGQGHA